MAAQLSGTGFFLAAASAISFIFGAAGWGLPAAAVLVTGVAAPVLTAAALLVLAGPALGIGARRAAAVLFSALVGFTLLALAGLSFSAGMNQADAGLPRDAFASSTPLFALGAAGGLAVAVGLCLFAALRRSGRLPVALAALASSAGGLAGALLIAVSLLPPFAIALGALAVFLVAALPLLRGGTAARASRAPNRSRVRLLATASVAFTAVVWGGGLASSIALTGTDGATSAIGTAAGAAQLAAVPLLLAATHILAARLPHARQLLWLGCAVAVVGVVAVATVMVAAYTPDGDRFVRLIGALGLAVGAWVGAVVGAMPTGQSAGARWALAAVAVAIGAFVYAMIAATAGIALLFASALLAVGARMPAPGITPATPQASS